VPRSGAKITEVKNIDRLVPLGYGSCDKLTRLGRNIRGQNRRD